MKTSLKKGLCVFAAVFLVLGCPPPDNDEENPPDMRFISVWETAASNETITLPLLTPGDGGNYDFDIDWGDGYSETITLYTDAAHTYADPGSYTVIIDGTIVGYNFALNPAESSRIMEISNFGCLQPGNDGYYFDSCDNLLISAEDALNLTGMDNLSYAFRDCTALTDIPGISDWDLSGITNMRSMFDGASSFNPADISWNTGNVSNMRNIFNGAVMFDADISGWDITSVTNMGFMFQGVQLSTDIYDRLLNGWAGQTINTGVVFDAGGSRYSDSGETGKNILTGTYSWTIDDGGHI